MTLPSQRISLVTLGVADLSRARAFYAALGWVEAQATGSVVFFQMQGQALALFGLDDLAQDQGRAGASLGTGAMTMAQNFTTPADVDAAFATALAAGATALKAPETVFWGGAIRVITLTPTGMSGKWPIIRSGPWPRTAA